MSWLAISLFGKRILGAVWGWLSHASFWQLVSIALLILCAILMFQRNDARSDAARWEKQFRAVKAQLDAISSKRNLQHEVTERAVEKVVRGDPVVRTVVKTIHDAPNPPDCKTPALSEARGAL
jgi:hypothetical protein